MIKQYDDNGIMWSYSFAENKRDGVMVCVIAQLDHPWHGDNPPLRHPDHTYYGVAFCSVKDDYDKLRGMRLSLHRALRNSPVAPSSYAAVWAEWVRRYVKNGVQVRGSVPSKQFCKDEIIGYDFASGKDMTAVVSSFDGVIHEIARMDAAGKLKPVI